MWPLPESCFPVGERRNATVTNEVEMAKTKIPVGVPDQTPVLLKIPASKNATIPKEEEEVPPVAEDGVKTAPASDEVAFPEEKEVPPPAGYGGKNTPATEKVAVSDEKEVPAELENEAKETPSSENVAILEEEAVPPTAGESLARENVAIPKKEEVPLLLKEKGGKIHR